MTADFIKTTHTLLTRDEELHLFDAWYVSKRDENTREANRLLERIVIQFSPLVKKMVNRMKGYNMDPDELTSEALVGIVHAANNFDSSMGFRFGTYASNCIRNTLFSYITKNYFMTDVCSNSKNKKMFFRLRREMSDQIKRTGKTELTHENIEALAVSLDVGVDAIYEMSNLLREPYQSLNQVLQDDDQAMVTRQDMLSSEEVNGDIGQERELALVQTDAFRKKLITEALDTLDERTRYILESQRLGEDDPMTLNEIGLERGISKERVRQLRNRGEEVIRAHARMRLRDMGMTPADLFD